MCALNTPRRRVRRTPDQARRAILDAAEKHLIKGGPDAVRVQVVAADLGLTDAAVHHHFGSRRGLLEALLRRAGRHLRGEIARILESWDGDPPGLRRIANLIADTYASRGYARLALWLSLSGWHAAGSGMFAPLAEAVHRSRLELPRSRGAARPTRQDTQHAVALLNLALIAEPLLGPALLRSVELGADAKSRARFRRWLVGTLERTLLADADRPGSVTE